MLRFWEVQQLTTFQFPVKCTNTKKAGLLKQGNVDVCMRGSRLANLSMKERGELGGGEGGGGGGGRRESAEKKEKKSKPHTP